MNRTRLRDDSDTEFKITDEYLKAPVGGREVENKHEHMGSFSKERIKRKC